MGKIIKNIILLGVAVAILLFYLYVFMVSWNANKIFGIFAAILLIGMYIVVVKFLDELRRWEAVTEVKGMALKAFNALLIFLNFSLVIFTLLISYGVSLTFGLSITVLVLVMFGIVVLYCFCL